jgi:serine/threonine protein kinase
MPGSALYCINCGTANPQQAAFCFACGQALHKQPVDATNSPSTGSLPHDHLLNQQRYRILNQLGAGGFGAVYKAQDTLLGNRFVAVKEMSQSDLKPSEVATAVDSFNQEALMLASLTHPNLPRIYDHFSDSGRWYLVMDFIEGKTLEEHLAEANHAAGKEQGLPVDETLTIGMQLCVVLDYLHSRHPPIIFRDLKPANVILSPDGHLYLIDFGIARHFKPGKSKDTMAFGSPGYAAPEQYGRMQTNSLADIYSLGATLHQMLTGHDPSLTPFRMLPPRQYDPSIPPALDALIMQMLDMDAQKRPTSVAIIQQALQHIMSQPSSGTTTSAQSFPSPTTTASSTPTGHTVIAYCNHTSQANTVAYSPDGQFIASADNTKVHVWRANDGHTLSTYPGHSGPVNAVAWSADGRYLASASDDKTVQVWIVMHIGGTVTRAYVLDYQNHFHKVNTLAWSPHKHYIASASFEETVHVWNATNGHTLFTGGPHTRQVQTLAWSPNAQYLATGSADSTIQIWDSHNGNEAFRYHTSAGANALAWSPEGQHIAIGCTDATIHCLAFLSGMEEFTCIGHSSPIRVLSWSPDGRYLASASDDKVQLWDATTGQQLYTYHGHLAPVNAVCWSPDGRYLASASTDQTVQIWKAP